MRLQDFIGNQKMVDLLRARALPEASLFTGPAGVGKRTLALALAALANCKSPSSHDLCESCPSCVKVSLNSHPDIILFSPEKGKIRIESMRWLSKEAHFRPFEGAYRFFIIDQAEEMTIEAANSILKTLEEPPETTRLILISELPRRLLATIRSRCQTFSFRSLRRKEIVDCLQKQGKSEDCQVRAMFSEGSIGTALQLDVDRTLEDRDRMFGLLKSWCTRKSFQLLYEACQKQPLMGDLKKRDRVKRYLELLQLLLEDLYFISAARLDHLVNQDRMEDLERLSKNIELDWIKKFLYYVERSKWEVDHYVNPLMCFETLWLRTRTKNADVRDFHGQI